MQTMDTDAQAKAIGIGMHGDEGQGKGNKSVLILSWSSVGVHMRSTLCKFPYAVTYLWRLNSFDSFYVGFLFSSRATV